MENELSFERKISFEPLLISIFFGIIVATIMYSMFPKFPLIGLICGMAAFVLESMLIYPRYLSKSYGYWKIDNQGIYYYDYSTWIKRIRAIFLPANEKVREIPFSNIKTFSVVDGKSIMNTQHPLGGSLKAPLARKIHCFVIETNHQKVRLNCAWKTSGIPTTPADINRIVTLINSRI
ncbi:hypothetical protein [Companilactobacillus kimchiensis]|uniref:Uncharacterized protein n=1 Tax=Companilactobacillus kimchiensis TaxID=993692 RepID=A0A0R2LJT8_9LACO|nr:hypothetical protein [Companilactobacillus kimchiensis]KRN99255.1 hypothetical protein IV57_GL000477 [Companilactobacillus kimchiensis]